MDNELSPITENKDSVQEKQKTEFVQGGPHGVQIGHVDHVTINNSQNINQPSFVAFNSGTEEKTTRHRVSCGLWKWRMQ